MKLEDTIIDDPEQSKEEKLQKEIEELASDEDFNTIYPKLKAEDEAQQDKQEESKKD